MNKQQNITTQQIAIKKANAVYFKKSRKKISIDTAVQIQMEAMKLGFIFTEEAANSMAQNVPAVKEILSELSKLVGADKVWQPFYSNFPEEVFNASEIELFMNAISHYWTSGSWRPEITRKKIPSNIAEDVKLKKIGLIDQDSFLRIFTSLVGSNGSLTEYDKNVISFFFDEYEEETLISYMPNKIPFKETLCQVVALAHDKGMKQLIKVGVKTTVDVLRVATFMSGGDVSLAKSTKFKLKSSQRRLIVELLNEVVSEEDVARHPRIWNKLFHLLHIKSNDYASVKLKEIADKNFRGECVSFNSKVENAILNKDYIRVIGLLKNRGGDLVRRMDHLLRIFKEDHLREGLMITFGMLAKDIDTKVLLQVMAHFKHRADKSVRIAIPKGMDSKAIILPNNESLSNDIINDILNIINDTLTYRFSSLPQLGRVYVDPALKKAPVQLSMRNASDGLKVIQRGTRVPIGPKNIVRFFVHWIGQDIDLSAAFMDKDLNYHSSIAYYNPRNTNGYKAVHSGDITWAPEPDGACEFIDIDLTSIKDDRIRYIALDIRVFSGGSLADQKVNAGWMMRTKLGARGDHFDAKTVENRIALNSSGRNVIVAIFDIVTREVIWTDLPGSSSSSYSGNNVINNKAGVKEILKAAVELKQPTIYELLEYHISGRGRMVKTKEHADLIVDADIIFQYDKVLSEYVV